MAAESHDRVRRDPSANQVTDTAAAEVVDYETNGSPRCAAPSDGAFSVTCEPLP